MLVRLYSEIHACSEGLQSLGAVLHYSVNKVNCRNGFAMTTEP